MFPLALTPPQPIFFFQCPKTVAEEGAPYTDTCASQTLHDILEAECRGVLSGDIFSHCIQSDEQLEFYTRACIRYRHTSHHH